LASPDSASEPGDVLGPVDVLDADQPDEVRVRLVVVEGEAGELPHGLHRVQVLDVELLLEAADADVGPLQDGDVELLLAAEVVVDHPLGRAGLGGDLVDPRPGVAPVGELAGGHVEDLGLSALGVARPGRSGRHLGHGLDLVGQRLGDGRHGCGPLHVGGLVPSLGRPRVRPGPRQVDRTARARRLDDRVEHLQGRQAVPAAADGLGLPADDSGEVLDLEGQRVAALHLDGGGLDGFHQERGPGKTRSRIVGIDSEPAVPVTW
jgi:hypothetical protein